ncbi:hypothetical protein GXW83_12435 [Streptacidiphilus sp. PB12-B1b]|uniref:hypothetical protein n=1 Tax=Streptacidiphilus sp. PB12-B1b TaxID=2705012 RepID=UPI0015F98ABB|nr:hypothetical protein [Streptacidiphilus sp. PB12-B1b]QMU76427.1 hypothetical protein GXW83_12435 [Streptacidiphilus sp. PB12-B1b]
MARNARIRSTVRPARSVPCRVHGLREPARADLSAPAPTLLGIVTSAADFEALRSAGGTEYPAYRDYLRDMEALLASLVEAGGAVSGRAFHCGDLVDYCTRRGLPVADPQSHNAYIGDPAAEAEWVRHQGEPLPQFLRRLARARERALVHRQLDRLLSETAEAAETGVFPLELLVQAHQHGTETLRRMLAAAGTGRYRIVAALRPPEGPVEVWAELELDRGAVLWIEDADLDVLGALLCTGFALGLPGSVLLLGECPERGPVARGWDFDGRGFARRSAADVLQELSPGAAAWVAEDPDGAGPAQP